MTAYLHEPAWFDEVLPSVVPAGWRVLERRLDGAKYHHGLRRLLVILSAAIEQDGRRWLHLSCSHADRIPKWSELVDVKETFLGLERYAYKVVPPRSRYVNINPRVLHLFACLDGEPPLPDFTHGGETL